LSGLYKDYNVHALLENDVDLFYNTQPKKQRYWVMQVVYQQFKYK